MEPDDLEFGPDVPPARGCHPQAWMDITPLERVIEYNRNLPRGCSHKADYWGWPADLRLSYSFDPYAHTSHMDVQHTTESFFSGTCECNQCIANVGLERGSHWEYAQRKRRIKKP